MTEPEIRDALAKWQRRLRLEHWEITLDLDTATEDVALACCERSSDYERARIRLASNWREWTPDSCQVPDIDHSAMPPRSLDYTVVHELLHCSFHDLEHAGKVKYGLLTSDVDDIHEAQLDRDLERTIDRMAMVIVEAYAGWEI